LQASIHIVDDDEAVRDSLQILLEAHGYGVRGYAGGAEFLASFEAGARSCLVLDINMPGMSGIEALRAVRERWPGLPVVMITGRAENLAEAEAIGMGAQALLQKPFRDKVLVAAIEGALRALDG